MAIRSRSLLRGSFLLHLRTETAPPAEPGRHALLPHSPTGHCKALQLITPWSIELSGTSGSAIGYSLGVHPWLFPNNILPRFAPHCRHLPGYHQDWTAPVITIFSISFTNIDCFQDISSGCPHPRIRSFLVPSFEVSSLSWHSPYSTWHFI